MKKTAFLILGIAVMQVAGGAALAQKGPQPVIVAAAKKDNFADSVEALGTLRANETIVLTATVTETATAVNFEDGQRVEKGDILVEMMDQQEKAEVQGEQATVDEAKRQLERLKPLIASGAASKSLLDQRQREFETANARLEGVKSQMADRIIMAPFSGVLGLRNISVGAVLQPGTRITTLDDDSVMKLDFSVPSIFLSVLKPELEITALSEAFPGKEFKGKISSLDSQIDPVTRSVLVRAMLPNEDRLLRPGLLMRVEIMKDSREVIVIPEEAIVPEARKNYVFVADKTGDKTTVKKREITIGARRPGDIEIVKGLAEGELVVTHGTMNVTDGANVTIRAEDKGDEPLQEMLQATQKKPAQEGR